MSRGGGDCEALAQQLADERREIEALKRQVKQWRQRVDKAHATQSTVQDNMLRLFVAAKERVDNLELQLRSQRLGAVLGHTPGAASRAASAPIQQPQPPPPPPLLQQHAPPQFGQQPGPWRPPR